MLIGIRRVGLIFRTENEKQNIILFSLCEIKERKCHTKARGKKKQRWLISVATGISNLWHLKLCGESVGEFSG